MSNISVHNTLNTFPLMRQQYNILLRAIIYTFYFFSLKIIRVKVIFHCCDTLVNTYCFLCFFIHNERENNMSDQVTSVEIYRNSYEYKKFMECDDPKLQCHSYTICKVLLNFILCTNI